MSKPLSFSEAIELAKENINRSDIDGFITYTFTKDGMMCESSNANLAQRTAAKIILEQEIEKIVLPNRLPGNVN
jgi:hypothetical protein